MADDEFEDEAVDRLFVGHSVRRRIGHPAPKPLLAENRRRLSRILDELVRAHNWKEASGVLSVLLKGTPRGSTFWEDRRNFRVAMEILKRLGDGRNYQTKIKQIFEIWMGKLAWLKKNPKKKYMVHLELALFYISEGNIQEAYNIMKFLIQDNNSAGDPTANLLQGMILYQLWYSSLPSYLQINSDTRFTPEKNDATLNDFDEEHEMEISNGHNDTNIRDIRQSSRLDSESSIGNEKNEPVGSKNKVQKQFIDVQHGQEFYLSGSEINVEGPSERHHQSLSYSIFFAHGLEKILLPIELNQLSKEPQIVLQYRTLVNEQYNDAVKHLKVALHSKPSIQAALLPLVQLLLLGDRVEETLVELEESCHLLDTALPFRLRARILECFHSNNVAAISSCYENALERDPACSLSLERLIKMHKDGNYNTLSLFEKVTSHLDAADGKSVVWEEFALFLLKLNSTSINDYEDRVSVNMPGGSAGIMGPNRVPGIFFDGQARETWEYRCRWWMNRHFSKDTYFRELESGDYRLLTAKASCASHLYGPKFGYVQAGSSSLEKEGDENLLSFLRNHMQSSLSLSDILSGVC